MNILYRELAERIRGTVADLDLVVQRVMRAWPQAQKASVDQDAYLDSVALNLHGFYSGLERLFAIIARQIDDVVPQSRTWHRDLLLQMSMELQDGRPGVISPRSASTLDEYRRFRHLVRNVYTMNIMPDKMNRLVTTLPDFWPVLRGELLAFADFTDELASFVALGNDGVE